MIAMTYARLELARGQIAGAQIVIRLAQKPCRPECAVIDALAYLRLHHLDHGANKRARRVIFTAIPASIAHVFDLGLVEMGKLVLLLLRAEAQLVHQFERVAQRIAALKLVLISPKISPVEKF